MTWFHKKIIQLQYSTRVDTVQNIFSESRCDWNTATVVSTHHFEYHYGQYFHFLTVVFDIIYHLNIKPLASAVHRDYVLLNTYAHQSQVMEFHSAMVQQMISCNPKLAAHMLS